MGSGGGGSSQTTSWRRERQEWRWKSKTTKEEAKSEMEGNYGFKTKAVILADDRNMKRFKHSFGSTEPDIEEDDSCLLEGRPTRSCKVGPRGFSMVFEAGREIWTSEGEAKELAKKDFIEIMKQLERALGDKSFYGGDAFGFVDIIAIGLTSWFVAYEKFGGFNVEDHCPKFSAWMKRCMQRETVYLCWECNKTSTPEEHLNLALDFQVPNALPKTFYLNMMARQSTLSHTAVGSRFYRIEARPAPWPCNVVLLVSETKRDALDPVSFKR
ncbi:putative glutathione s-transferase [Quercus suber]|uniref:Glutathione s-transferase n=1 Tax=Quercus suber TaxID=58331 RepID=A0AAW0J0H2_QUESU